ncbi:MAG: hypothetical protein ACJ8EF_18405 [Bradyrhizobium sp.]|jgi:hypothetical protein
MKRHKSFLITMDASVMTPGMPLLRYFIYTGGVLLGLLLILDAYLTTIPMPVSGNAHLPVIRILSDRKWPERVVYDTSLPTIVPAQTANAETGVAGSAVSVQDAGNIRQAFAQVQPFQANLRGPSDSKYREPSRLRERKIAKRRAVPRTVGVVRQAQFGWFGARIW